ncbi:hypothetical protein MYCTH_2311136 [Thermothelomyces thermophilus ATCC 42464]|uniref:Zn(2)-C6 fungal-type domain-containing protein n=1 Tax=Thermothelomyces thermophilus (strain ATCC 42464 / BCRC 31852 / DSM 1799) TaxID=573729 RepID=G2QML9_THET4|nr:uncharacterized protein MYCTH_2311136 [Thermothelomyces thermophilus ATCC 42464]AEO61199.1 hypothetical protein MYCTH_2311136 [Thermothelomyces thermophilus ATCC 42464]
MAAPAPDLEREMPAKRRRVRKGTRSCWECKRRKIRCMLPAPGDGACIGCHHRGVACVPQDVPEDPFPVKKDKRRLGERLALIEQTLMKDFQVLAGNGIAGLRQTDDQVALKVINILGHHV